MRIWQRIRNKVWLREDWMTCDLRSLSTSEHGIDKESSAYRSLCFRLMNLEDLETLLRRFPEELSDRKYNILKNRLAEENMEVFTLISNDGMPSCYFCTSVKDTYESGAMVTVHMSANDVYLFDFYVFTPYRGQKIHKIAIWYCLQRYKEKGYVKAIANAYQSNQTAIRNIKENGFHYECSTVTLRPFGYVFRKVYRS